MRGVYYNEIDPAAAEVLHKIKAAGLIPDGDIDTRSIEEVTADDIRGYIQCHFFAGGGGWPLALRRAGFPDTRPVWSASAPCQGYSVAGEGAAQSDERHLWPHIDRLAGECGPAKIYGEQVANAIGFGWYDDVAHGMEAQGYACAAAVLRACSAGGFHQRARLYFVADGRCEQRRRRDTLQSAGAADAGAAREDTRSGEGRARKAGQRPLDDAADGGSGRGLGYVGHTTQFSERESHHERNASTAGRAQRGLFSSAGNPVSFRSVGNPVGQGLEGHAGDEQRRGEPGWFGAEPHGSAAPATSVEWVMCPDGKRRPVEPGIRLLVNEFPGRVAALRILGNALDLGIATKWIEATM